MRILIIRHGDPDYTHDTLTEKGKREALLLSHRLEKEKIDKIYCSPLGRAQDTAKPTALRIRKEIHTLPWLSEIDMFFDIENKTVSPWDIFPHIWTKNPLVADKALWHTHDIYKENPIGRTVQAIEAHLDALLLKHGFSHDGRLFRILPGYEESCETVAIFCHMGLGNVLLAHLGGIATPLWWHTMFLPPSSVSTVYMESHCPETGLCLAHFAGIGDVSHLYKGDEPISTSGLKNCAASIFPPTPTKAMPF